MSTDPISKFQLVSNLQRKSLQEAALRYAEGATDRTDFFRRRGLPDELVRKFKYGVVNEPTPEHLAYRGRISIPYKDALGVNYIVFRCPCSTKECEMCSDGAFKYMAGDGLYRPLYNSWVLDRDIDRLYVSEGEFNADVAMFCGFPTVATASATRFFIHWGYLLDGLEEIVILKDGDGDPKAAKNMVKLWRTNLPRESRVMINERKFPEGHDVNSLYKAVGHEATQKFILTGEL